MKITNFTLSLPRWFPRRSGLRRSVVFLIVAAATLAGPAARATRYAVKAPMLQFRAEHPFRVVTVGLEGVTGTLAWDPQNLFALEKEFTLHIPSGAVFGRNAFLSTLLRGFVTPENREPDWDFRAVIFETIRIEPLVSDPSRAFITTRGFLKVGARESEQRVKLECTLQEVPICQVEADWLHSQFDLPPPSFYGVHGQGVWRVFGEMSFAPEGL